MSLLILRSIFDIGKKNDKMKLTQELLAKKGGSGTDYYPF